MLRFEFIVHGTPRSFRSHNREALAGWIRSIIEAASPRFDPALMPFHGKVRVVVTYYHEGPIAGLDNDNMVKPVLDALTGIAYFDDRQASSLEVHSINLERGPRMRRVSALLAEAFEREGEFLHILVEERQ